MTDNKKAEGLLREALLLTDDKYAQYHIKMALGLIKAWRNN